MACCGRSVLFELEPSSRTWALTLHNDASAIFMVSNTEGHFNFYKGLRQFAVRSVPIYGLRRVRAYNGRSSLKLETQVLVDEKAYDTESIDASEFLLCPVSCVRNPGPKESIECFFVAVPKANASAIRTMIGHERWSLPWRRAKLCANRLDAERCSDLEHIDEIGLHDIRPDTFYYNTVFRCS
jgi:hypothetical protein